MTRFNPYHLPPNDPSLNIKGRMLRPKHPAINKREWTDADIKVARQFWKDNPLPSSDYPYWLQLFDPFTFQPTRSVVSNLSLYTTESQITTSSFKLPDPFIGQLLIFYYHEEENIINCFSYQIGDILSGQSLILKFNNPSGLRFDFAFAPDILRFYSSKDAITPSHSFDPSPAEEVTIIASTVTINIPNSLLTNLFIFSLSPSQ